MNLRVFFKSVKFAFRARRRVVIWMFIYAILFLVVSDGLAWPLQAGWFWYVLLALFLSTFYAILISQFRQRDMSILKCIGWGNNDVMILIVGEVLLVTLVSFLVLLQISFEILGIFAYFFSGVPAIFQGVVDFIVIQPVSLFTTFFVILAFQIPGLFIAQRRAISVPPMKALREE